MSQTDYNSFLDRKTHLGGSFGFDPIWMPDFLFDFQKHLIEWSLRRGRAAIFADCGLGKTAMQLVWADNVFRKTRKPVLALTPLAVANQTKREAQKFGIDAEVSRDGKIGCGVVISNYDMLHHFDANSFSGLVCDESSILKSVTGATRKRIDRFISKLPYRLLCTATAAPNDWIELGTSSEALGELSNSEMLHRFFRQLDDKGQKREEKLQEAAERLVEQDPQYFGKLAFRIAQTIGQWRLKNHAVTHFWKWVASWSRACRMPSDLGFNDGDFRLPALNERDHIIKPAAPPEGMLFCAPAVGLGEEREERKRTLKDRGSYAAELVDHNRSAVIWCHMNAEGDLLEEIIPEARQIAGRTPDEEKIELYEAFQSGQLRVLVIKPKIGAWGLNWQHCNHIVSFATHSYEQQYQSIRRCWRFGQKRPVQHDVIATEGEARVLANVRRKADQASKMFSALIREMNGAMKVERPNIFTKQQEVPGWLLNSALPSDSPHTMATA